MLHRDRVVKLKTNEDVLTFDIFVNNQPVTILNVVVEQLRVIDLMFALVRLSDFVVLNLCCIFIVTTFCCNCNGDSLLYNFLNFVFCFLNF